jgi:hypothetical protein
MKYLLALFILPSCFLTEYYLAAQWMHVIHVSWWWTIYVIVADLNNGLLLRSVIGLPLLAPTKKSKVALEQ